MHVVRAEIAGLERERQLAQREVEAEKKKAEDLARERDILTKLNSQAENTSHKHMEMIRLNENTRRTLEQEISGFKVESRKQQKVGLHASKMGACWVAAQCAD